MIYLSDVMLLCAVLCCAVQVDEDPLGSGDDEADSESEDKGDFDTEDTVACQWEKVQVHTCTHMYMHVQCI